MSEATTKRRAGRPRNPHRTERKQIHLYLPTEIADYIFSVTDNANQWLIQAAQEKMEREQGEANERQHFKPL